jgi:hypothetical protein
MLVLIITDSGDESGIEGVIGESEEDARLAHARVSNQKQFEQQVVRLLRHLKSDGGVIRTVVVVEESSSSS